MEPPSFIAAVKDVITAVDDGYVTDVVVPEVKTEPARPQTAVLKTVSPKGNGIAKDYKSEMLALQGKFKEEVKTSPGKNGTTEKSNPGEKRKAMFPELFSSGAKKTKTGPVQPKNACVALNEYKPGLEYVLVDQIGPVHDPKFIMKVCVNSKDFTGEGRVGFRISVKF